MKEYTKKITCEACESKELVTHIICTDPIKLDELSSANFKVTNKEYSRCVETFKCTNCGLVQPQYNLEFSDIVKFYADVVDDEYLNSSETRGISNYNQVSKLIKKFAPKAQSIIEIGSGSGKLVSLLKKDYSKVVGVEPNESFCKFAKENYGVEMKQMGYEELDTNEKYDVIMALDVIEHVVSPKDFMQKIESLLTENGIVILGTPDIGSVSSKILKKKWYHIRPPHLYYFSDKSFLSLSKLTGLKLLQKGFFSWTFPASYLIDAVQKLVFKKALLNLSFMSFKVKVNLFDSKIYVLRKA